MAMTTVASSTSVRMLKYLKAYRNEIIAAGMTINSRAFKGVRVRGSIFDTHSGSMRSMEAAKMTRVELRNSVPDQPNHHKLISRTMMNWISPAIHQEGGEQRRVGPDRKRRRLGCVTEGVVPEGAIGLVVKIPAERLGNQGHENQTRRWS